MDLLSQKHISLPLPVLCRILSAFSLLMHHHSCSLLNFILFCLIASSFNFTLNKLHFHLLSFFFKFYITLPFSQYIYKPFLCLKYYIDILLMFKNITLTFPYILYQHFPGQMLLCYWLLSCIVLVFYPLQTIYI